MKSLTFWLAIVVVAIAAWMVANRNEATVALADVAGEWLMGGAADQPCAVFRNGEVLLVVNERGDLATARMAGAAKLAIVKGTGWMAGVTAELHDDGRSLVWSDGSTWKRR
ncbi:MAG TPA: hypothetical protein VFV78_10885 [Vicinamibacterales bacterium]|nr:hypothetical protein [Vicinamibacterales bacterium]